MELKCHCCCCLSQVSAGEILTTFFFFLDLFFGGFFVPTRFSRNQMDARPKTLFVWIMQTKAPAVPRLHPLLALVLSFLLVLAPTVPRLILLLASSPLPQQALCLLHCLTTLAAGCTPGFGPPSASLMRNTTRSLAYFQDARRNSRFKGRLPEISQCISSTTTMLIRGRSTTASQRYDLKRAMIQRRHYNTSSPQHHTLMMCSRRIPFPHTWSPVQQLQSS